MNNSNINVFNLLNNLNNLEGMFKWNHLKCYSFHMYWFMHCLYFNEKYAISTNIGSVFSNENIVFDEFNRIIENEL